MSEKIKSILLTGPPGIGKSTIIKLLSKILQEHHINCSGFYTEEIRLENGSRIGFDIVSLHGERGVLARQNPDDNVKRPKIGKYHIYVNEFEEIALPVLKVTAKTILIIDEIGKMELLSKSFKKRFVEIYGKTLLLATITKGPLEPILQQMKENKTALTMEVTKANRYSLVEILFEKACQMLLE